jgi:hypothetical protein
MPQTGTGGLSVGRIVKESAMGKSPRVATQRQATIAAVAHAHPVLVNGAASVAAADHRAGVEGCVTKFLPSWFGPALQYSQKRRLWERRRLSKSACWA